MTGVTYDIAALRSHFPALATGTAHFDGPGGAQVPDVVADAVRATLLSSIANRAGSRRPSAEPTTSCWPPARQWPTCSAPTRAASCSVAA